MRELKFRAWDNVDKKWLFGYDYNGLGGFNLLGEVVLLGELSSISLDRLKDIEIDQFTGLQDKNLVDIYEGDVIKWCFVNTGDLDEKEYTEVVEWNECGFFLDGGAPLTVAMDDCEVIGNIHQNPELI